MTSEAANPATKETRAREHAKTHTVAVDLVDFIIDAIFPFLYDATEILDIGCGAGRHTLSIAQRLPDGARIQAIDISLEAIYTLQMQSAFHFANVNAGVMDMDEVPQSFAHKRYDAIISLYAIHYSRDMIDLLRRLRNLLSSRGVVFICGHGAGTNQEIIDIANLPSVKDFFGPSHRRALEDTYSISLSYRLENKARFRRVDQFLSWYRHHELFDDKTLPHVKTAVEKEIKRKGHFELTKNTQGVALVAEGETR
jgi:cyclopropane fatty-acyl-phospholipid synthase-like methyltransferase